MTARSGPREGVAVAGGRLGRRAAIHGTAVLVVAAVFLLAAGQSGWARLSLGTAYAGLLLLGATLAIGPLNLLRGRRNPPSTGLRREIGIAAGIFSLLHVAIGLQVHFGGDMLAYFFRRLPEGGLALRGDLFGFANHGGLVAGLLIVMLLALSNNASLRALTIGRWKALQRCNYAVVLLVVGHGAIYQWLEGRAPGFVAAFAAVAVLAAAAQVAGVIRTRQVRP